MTRIVVIGAKLRQKNRRTHASVQKRYFLVSIVNNEIELISVQIDFKRHYKIDYTIELFC